MTRERLQQAARFRPAMVAVTGWGQDADRKKSGLARFDRHQARPVDSGALQAVFERRAPAD